MSLAGTINSSSQKQMSLILRNIFSFYRKIYLYGKFTFTLQEPLLEVNDHLKRCHFLKNIFSFYRKLYLNFINTKIDVTFLKSILQFYSSLYLKFTNTKIGVTCLTKNIFLQVTLVQVSNIGRCRYIYYSIVSYTLFSYPIVVFIKLENSISVSLSKI